MPKTYPQSKLYFCFSRKTSFFTKKKLGFQWDLLSAEEADRAFEPADLLEKINPDETNIQQVINQIQQNLSDQKIKTKALKISLEHFNRVCTVLALFPIRVSQISFFISLIQELVRNDYSIAFNFSEVFLTSTPLPSHYRPSEDMIEDDSSYESTIASFGYQFAKALFNNFKPEINENSSATEKLIASHYASSSVQKQVKTNLSLETPIPSLTCFNSAYEAVIQDQIENTENDWIILNFKTSPSLANMELFNCLNYFNYSNNWASEIILILHSESYEDSSLRNQIYVDLLATITILQCRSLLHLILLTEDVKSLNPEANLISLAPDRQNHDLFSPLAQDAGYYLNAPILFATIGKNIRERNTARFTSNWLDPAKKAELKEAKPELEESKGYIYGQEPVEKIRQSKRYNKQELKSQIGLTFNFNLELQQEMQQELNQSQSLQQNQDLSTEQNLVQQKQQNLKHHVDCPFYIPPMPISFLLDKIRTNAALAYEHLPKEELLAEQSYYTTWYRENYSWRAFLTQLKSYPPSETLIDLVTKIGGLAYTISPEMENLCNHNTDNMTFTDGVKLWGYVATKSFTSPLHFTFGKYLPVALPNYSCESVEDFLINFICNRLPHFSDGLNPALVQKGHSYLLGNTVLQGWEDLSVTSVAENFKTYQLPLTISYLALLAPSYTSHLIAYLPLRGSENYLANSCSLLASILEIFKPVETESTDFIQKKEKKFLKLIKLLFPNYFDRVNKFINSFEVHNLDNLRILVQLLISVDQEKFIQFLDYLDYLDQRGLLTNFYKIYFKYAPTVCSLLNFFETTKGDVWSFSKNYGEYSRESLQEAQSKEDSFIKLSMMTAPVDSAKDWTQFERFAHALLVFAAKNHMQLNSKRFSEIESFWHRIEAKFLIYAERSHSKQQALLELFLANLLSEEGLTLANLRKLDTVLVCLENLLDQVIENKNLEEQLEELAGISLAWTDVPYAMSYNGFHLVCQEMEIKAGSIGSEKASYDLSLQELKQAINGFNAESPSLKTKVFRYLGKESFREKLDFYRKIYPLACENQQQNKLNELIWAYYVCNFTGNQYNALPDPVSFINQGLLFLQNHPYAKGIAADPIVQISKFLAQLFQSKPQCQTGSMTLWTLWQEHQLFFQVPSKLPLPKILGYKFERAQLKHFLLANSKELNTAIAELLPYLVKTNEFKPTKKGTEIDLTDVLIENLFGKEDKLGLQTFNIVFPNLQLPVFLEQLLDILPLIENLKQVKKANLPIVEELQAILMNRPELNLANYLLKLCREKLQNYPERIKPCSIFLHYLATHLEFLPEDPSKSSEFELILDHWLLNPADEKRLPLLFWLAKTLDGEVETLKIFLELLHDERVCSFLYQNWEAKLAASLLKQVAIVIKRTKDPLAILQLISVAPNNFSIETLLSLVHEKLCSVLYLCNFIANHETFSLNDYLDRLSAMPSANLNTLVYLCKYQNISITLLDKILKSPSTNEAIDTVEEELYQQDLPAYHYDPIDIAEKISEIQYNSWDNSPAQSLSPESQRQLVQDYQKLMGYILTRPIYTEMNDGKNRSYTVHELKMRHFPFIFKELQSRIQNGRGKKETQLVLLAVCAVALKRTCKKFPRSTQLIPLLHSLSEEGHLVQVLKTGAGKSIVIAMHAVLRIAAGRTALIPTENEKLGRDGIDNFQDFYRYLGIQSGERIIEAQSMVDDFVPNGVNYTTPYGQGLFFFSMAIKKERLSKNCDLIWDEIDASLTSTVPFRLAAPIDPILLDTLAWSKIYNYMLDFVKEKELFLDNHCSDNDDINNFRQYCLLQNPEKKLTEFLKQVTDSYLGTLIDSARLAVQLEENVDYFVVEKEDGKKSLYAAPILPHDSRPEPRAGFGFGAQYLLHSDKNKLNTDEDALLFSILADTETIVSMTPKNLADGIRRGGGKIVGTTATPVEEFLTLYDITSFRYPHFYPDRCQDLGLIPAEGWPDQKKEALNLILKTREESPNLPVLIICESAQMAKDFYTDLDTSQYPFKTQAYYGYSSKPEQEANFIIAAGNDNTVSISTKCESRGADFDTFLVINMCTALTEEELIQIKGRAARNGKQGRFCSVVDVLQLGLKKTAKPEELAHAFKAYRQALGLKAQKDRARNRFLEDSRYLLICCLLDLRQKADRILSLQHGELHSLVNVREFMKILRDFNKKTETYYLNLQKGDDRSESEKREVFLIYLANEYNQILENWLPDEKFTSYRVIEPLIPLEKLKDFKGINSVKIKKLLLLSELLSKGWQTVGHQPISTYLPVAQQVANALDDYYKTGQGLKTIAAKILINLQLISIPRMNSIIEQTAESFTRIIDDLPADADKIISRKKALTFINEYSSTLQKALLEERWEELSLPDLPTQIFFEGDESDSSLFSDLSQKGLAGIGSWGAKIIAKTGAKLSAYALLKLYFFPQLMKALQEQREKISSDETTQLKVLKSFEELESPLIDFVLAIPNYLQSEDGLWSLLLDHLLPLLEHPATKQAMSLISSELGRLLEALIILIKEIQIFKTKPIKELLNLKNLLPLFQLACQLELVQQLGQHPLAKEFFNRFSSLDTNFFSSFDQFDFRSFVDFCYLLAHPVFFKFLRALPQEASFRHLKTWLNPETKKIPEAVRPALIELYQYQEDRERLEETKRAKLQGLKNKFSLTPERIQQDLKALEPKFPEPIPPPEPSLASRLYAWICLHQIKSFFAIVGIILFSWIILPVVLISALIYALKILYEKIMDYLDSPNPVEELGFAAITQDLRPAESPLSFDELQFEEELSSSSEEDPAPTFHGLSVESSSEKTRILEEINPKISKLSETCYPSQSSFSPGLFINGNNPLTIANLSLVNDLEPSLQSRVF